MARIHSVVQIHDHKGAVLGDLTPSVFMAEMSKEIGSNKFLSDYIRHFNETRQNEYAESICFKSTKTGKIRVL